MSLGGKTPDNFMSLGYYFRGDICHLRYSYRSSSIRKSYIKYNKTNVGELEMQIAESEKDFKILLRKET